jgi:hypothetical protein
MKMRTSFPATFTTLAAALLAVAALTTHAQTWQTVDDFQQVAGLGAVSGDIGTDPAGNIYAVGSGITTADGSGRVAVINMSADHGATWTTLPEFAEPGWSWAHYRAFTSDASGRLYVGGNGRMADWPAQQPLSCIIRESVDGGATWTATDNSEFGCADLKVNPATGDVYASGSSAATLGWIVRKRAPGDSQFTTVDLPFPSGSGWAIGFHPTRGVLVVGDPYSVWTVRRSASGNAGTWATVDSFYSSTEWTSGHATYVVVANSGTIYVAGWAYSTRTQKNQWIVRTSADGGTTWTISDNFNYGGATLAVWGMTQDAAGNLFVCGQAANSAGSLYWLVRKGTPGTKLVKQGGKWVRVPTMTWTTSDVFQLASGKEAVAFGITGDALGNVFVSGRAADATGVDHWIVRKLTP